MPIFVLIQGEVCGGYEAFGEFLLCCTVCHQVIIFVFFFVHVAIKRVKATVVSIAASPLLLVRPTLSALLSAKLATSDNGTTPSATT